MLDKTLKVLTHIIKEQEEHGSHGDQEYIRLCHEAIEEIKSIKDDSVYSMSPQQYLELTNKL
jgi:hypothetical protein